MLVDSIISDANLKKLRKERPTLYSLCDEELSERDLAQIMQNLAYYRIHIDYSSTTFWFKRSDFFRLFYLIALWQLCVEDFDFIYFPCISYIYKTEVHNYRTIIGDSLNPVTGIKDCFDSMGITDKHCYISNINNTINFSVDGIKKLFKLILRSLNMYRY